jgi:hypothetical protein
VTLVQIDLRRDRARAGTDAAEGDPARPEEAAAAPGAVPSDSPSSDATTGLVLGGGLVLLAPLATLALAQRSALFVLLIGLAALGLFAALVRPGPAEVDVP